MRLVAYGLMASGVLVAATSLVVLTWPGSPHAPFTHNAGIVTALFLGGAAITYLGMLVRRRDKVVKDRQRAA